MNDYQTQARERWQGTRAYDEYTEKTAGYTKKTWKEANDGLTKIIKKFAKCKKGGFPLNLRRRRRLSNNYKVTLQSVFTPVTTRFWHLSGRCTSPMIDLKIILESMVRTPRNLHHMR